MKLTINQGIGIQETEIIINCASLDSRIRNLADYIRQYSTALEGMIGDVAYYVPLDSILYIDSVEKKVFFYDSHRIYSCQYRLAELENRLRNTLFVRISKNCIVNFAYIRHTAPYSNRRLELMMTNGERLIVGRSYYESFRQRFRAYSNDIFHPSAFAVRSVLDRDPERSVYNAGRVLGFPAVPKRVVALSFGAAELLAALGVTDRLVAIVPAEGSIGQVLPQYRGLLEDIPVLPDYEQGVPTAAALKGLEADLVVGNYYALDSLKRFNPERLRCGSFHLYVSEGTVPGSATMEGVYKDILNLGRIFRVEQRAIELAEELRRRIGVLTRRVSGRRQRPVRVFVYDSRREEPITALCGTLETDLIECAGGSNVFGGQDGSYGSVTWEQVAQCAPEVIVVNGYCDYMTAEEKIEYLKNNPLLQQVPAVKNERFVVLSHMEMFPGLQNPCAVEKLISCFYPELL